MFAFICSLLMDDDGLNMRNWGYYEQSLRGNLGLQLMSSVVDRDTKPFLTRRENPIMLGANGVFHSRDSIIPEAPLSHIDYVRDGWINHREKFLNMFPGSPYTTVLPETSASHSMQMIQQPDATKDVGVNAEEPPSVRKESGPSKRKTGGATPKAPKAKKSKKASSVPKENGNPSVQRAKPAKKSMDIVINGIDMDITGIPIPVCSCTGAPQQCYRWGCGGWQSACCTTSISMYPLPMSTKRRGARIAGRKMSQGAFKKVLEKLAAEGYNFANPIDLRTHWAKHGTNKFVTIR
ncbi:Protein BASIC PENTACYSTEINE1 [Capsicum annuum]|uniref:GAGA-binding transcriptional activator n=2 Tax=Capsicum annuum TaxID=4072 RepID=A0A2G2ZGY4_CAPAN|nr:Protein BASIC PENTACYSTEINE1 [Capsicum annuum]PHT81250.1 Protein BASIC PENTACYSTEINE1 [Capsicum annuum]